MTANLKPLTYDELATLYDKHHGGRKARIIPIWEVVAWSSQRTDLFEVDDEDNICLKPPAESFPWGGI